MQKINKEEALTLFLNEGYSVKELAEHYHVTISAIYRWLRNINKAPKSHFTPVADEAICQLYVNGESTYSLGKKFKCSHNTIKAIVARHNIKIRGIHDYPRIPANAVKFLKHYMQMHGASLDDVIKQLVQKLS